MKQLEPLDQLEPLEQLEQERRYTDTRIEEVSHIYKIKLMYITYKHCFIVFMLKAVNNIDVIIDSNL